MWSSRTRGLPSKVRTALSAQQNKCDGRSDWSAYEKVVSDVRSSMSLNRRLKSGIYGTSSRVNRDCSVCDTSVTVTSPSAPDSTGASHSLSLHPATDFLRVTTASTSASPSPLRLPERNA